MQDKEGMIRWLFAAYMANDRRRVADALADDFRSHRFDLKRLTRLLVTSQVYGRSSTRTPDNQGDRLGIARFAPRRLPAEVLLDAICDVTEVRESFSAMPADSRAVELWTHRVDSLFLDAFGRPDANQDPPCERTGDTTVVQALHLMNAPGLHEKVASNGGRAARLAKSSLGPGEVVDELYLAVYARYPTAEERRDTTALYSAEGADRRRVTEDLLWALLNTPEFVFKD